VKITLSYKRDAGAETSSGILMSEGGVVRYTRGFTGMSFPQMISRLCDELRHFPEVDVFIERTDREGLVPYKLDPETVALIRNDPVAAVSAMTYTTASPSTAERRAKQRDVPIVPAPLHIGTDVLAEAFGDDLYFRVRAHELECPGCGFWSPFTTPGLLADPDRVGEIFSTAFACAKKCKCRILVRCWERWGSVSTRYLLERTTLEAFYFPRPWNEGRPWIGRRELQLKFDKYNKEKDDV